VALGNDVIVCARTLIHNRIPGTGTFPLTEVAALEKAVQLYEAEIARAQPESPRHPCTHPRIAWVFEAHDHISCGDCGAPIPVKTVKAEVLRQDAHYEKDRQT
jgi:hypothetical protein